MLAIRFIRRVLWDCLSMERLGLLPVTVIPVSGWDCVGEIPAAYDPCFWGDGDTGFRLGLRPGLSLKATEHISFVTKVGFLGYSDSYNGTSDFGGVNFDTENISIGFHYNF